MPVSNFLSPSAFRVELYFEDKWLGHATAFLYERAGETYLVTNYHVVSGRRSDTNALIDTVNGSVPNKLELSLPVLLEENGERGVQYSRIFRINLYTEDGQPPWYVHPVRGREIDIVVIGLPQRVDGRTYFTVNKALELEEQTEPFTLEAGMDAFIIGFPLDKPKMRLPIWKRGTIASEPTEDVDGLPYILVDTATRSGMSGSPVIGQVDGPWNPPGVVGITGQTNFARGRSFIGVYSGRWGADNFQAQLGIVWRVDALNEIIDAIVDEP